jgi:hypothetical protein
MGLYLVLGILFVFLIWRELELGPGNEHDPIRLQSAEAK